MIAPIYGKARELLEGRQPFSNISLDTKYCLKSMFNVIIQGESSLESLKKLIRNDYMFNSKQIYAAIAGPNRNTIDETAVNFLTSRWKGI